MDPKELEFLDALPHPILTLSYDGIITFCNKAGKRLQGLYALNGKHNNFTQWLDSRSCIEFFKVCNNLSADSAIGSIFPIRFKGQDENSVPYRITACLLDNGFGFSLRIEKTDDLDQSSKMYRMFAENTHDVNWMFQGDQLYVYESFGQRFPGLFGKGDHLP